MAGKHTEIQIPTANLPRDEDQRRRKLLRHSDALQIIAAWIITVPATAVLSSVLFVVLRAVLF